MITNAKFTNTTAAEIIADFNGRTMTLPVDPGNRHYAEIVKKEIEIAPYVEPEPTWQEKRVADYGSVGDQLDMQYWDGVNDTTVWPDHIAQVKADYPKPT